MGERSDRRTDWWLRRLGREIKPAGGHLTDLRFFKVAQTFLIVEIDLV
jgi:hypothetical protein